MKSLTILLIVILIFSSACEDQNVTPKPVLSITPAESDIDSLAQELNLRLVAYYPFNANANDESGNEHHLEVKGATLTFDRFGRGSSAYYFDGAENELILEDQSGLDLTANITICAWFKTKTPQWGTLVANYDQFRPDNGYELGIGSLYETGGFVYFECAKDDIRDGISTYSSFHDGEWHFVVATFMPDVSLRGRVFVDGIELSGHYNPLGGPISAIGPTPDYPFKIGALSRKTGPEHDANFKGVIDDVRIYEGALNEAQIDSLYNEEAAIAI